MHKDFHPEILPKINCNKIICLVFLFILIDKMRPFTSCLYTTVELVFLSLLLTEINIMCIVKQIPLIFVESPDMLDMC